MEDYKVIKAIGKGSFGKVYLVKHVNEGRSYVLKVIKVKGMPVKERESCRNEVLLMQRLAHPNIVAFKDSFFANGKDNLCIVMTYCDGGDLAARLAAAKGALFKEDQVMHWFVQIALAVHYMHEKRVLHRDIKAQNIFLLGNGRLVIGDLGISKVLDGTVQFASTQIGTPYYMSPELFKNKPYNHKSDVWALGCVLYEMCALAHPFDAATMAALGAKVGKGSYAPINSRYSAALRALVDSMLAQSPSARPSVAEVLEQPYLKKYIYNFVKDAAERGAAVSAVPAGGAAGAGVGGLTMAFRAGAMKAAGVDGGGAQQSAFAGAVAAGLGPHAQSLNAQLVSLGLQSVIAKALADAAAPQTATALKPAFSLADFAPTAGAAGAAPLAPASSAAPASGAAPRPPIAPPRAHAPQAAPPPHLFSAAELQARAAPSGGGGGSAGEAPSRPQAAAPSAAPEASGSAQAAKPPVAPPRSSSTSSSSAPAPAPSSTAPVNSSGAAAARGSVAVPPRAIAVVVAEDDDRDDGVSGYAAGQLPVDDDSEDDVLLEAAPESKRGGRVAADVEEFDEAEALLRAEHALSTRRCSDLRASLIIARKSMAAPLAATAGAHTAAAAPRRPQPPPTQGSHVPAPAPTGPALSSAAYALPPSSYAPAAAAAAAAAAAVAASAARNTTHPSILPPQPNASYDAPPMAIALIDDDEGFGGADNEDDAVDADDFGDEDGNADGQVDFSSAPSTLRGGGARPATLNDGGGGGGGDGDDDDEDDDDGGDGFGRDFRPLVPAPMPSGVTAAAGGASASSAPPATSTGGVATPAAAYGDAQRVDAARLARELESAIGSAVFFELRAAVRATLWSSGAEEAALGSSSGGGGGGGGAAPVDALAARFCVDETVIDAVSSLIHLEMDGVIGSLEENA